MNKVDQIWMPFGEKGNFTLLLKNDMGERTVGPGFYFIITNSESG